MKKKQDEKLADILKSHNLKITEDRMSVLGYLVDKHGVHTINEIQKKVRGVDMVTVYRILKMFVSRGLVYQTDFRRGKAYFEYQKIHHHHIICSKCGKKEDIAACIPDAYIARVKLKLRYFKIISNHILEFFGVCSKCSISRADS